MNRLIRLEDRKPVFSWMQIYYFLDINDRNKVQLCKPEIISYFECILSQLHFANIFIFCKDFFLLERMTEFGINANPKYLHCFSSLKKNQE